MSPIRTYIGAALIAIAGILFWVLVMPAYDYMGALRSALDDRNQILDNRTTIINNIASLMKQYSDNASAITQFSYVVPATKSPAELVSTIQALASQNGLTLNSIALTQTQLSQDQNPYAAQPVEIALTGSYLALRAFLAALEHNTRLIDISSIDANPTAGNSASIGFRIHGNAYFLKP